MKKFHLIFKAGNYPQGNITEADLKEIADSYNPNYHEAPLTLDHKEPGPALGWIESVRANGKNLYASFRDLTDEAISLTRDKKYKRTSPEITVYDNKKYLRALSLVNIPAAKGLPAVEFKDDNTTAFYNEFTIDFHKPNFTDVEEIINKFAEKIGLNISEFNSETGVLDKAGEIITNLKTQLGDANNKINSLNLTVQKYIDEGISIEKFSEYKTKIDTLENEIRIFREKKITDLIDSAISAGKILPANKDLFIKYAETDYEGTKNLLQSLTPTGLLNNNQVPTITPDATDPKFYKEDGKKITYKDILDNPELQKKFSEQETQILRNEYYK